MSPRTLSLLLTVISLGVCHCESACNYYDLLQNLSLSDSSNSRPVKDWNTPSVVWINMFLYAIVELDSNLQTLTSFVWFSMLWENEFTTWNPDDFCGINKISVPSKYFWKPDLYIDEIIQDEKKSPEIPYYVLFHNGTIVNQMPLRIISSCSLDIFKFPFDTQTCDLSFGSYVYTVTDLVMWPSLNSSVVTENSKKIFSSKGDWNIVNITVTNQTYEAEGDWYNKVIYEISIRRASVVYVINLIIPACFLVLLDIFSMFIQMGTGERLGFKINIVLGFSVLLLILNDLLPNSESPSVLGIFCCVCLAIMVLSAVGSILISYMLSQSDTQPDVPPWIKTWILRRLARILCFKTNAMKEDLINMDKTSSEGSEDVELTETNGESQQQRDDTNRETKSSLEVRLLKKLLVEILKIHQAMTNAKSERDEKSDWYMAALVVDRLVLIVYLFTVVIIFAIVIIVWAS